MQDGVEHVARKRTGEVGRNGAGKCARRRVEAGVLERTRVVARVRTKAGALKILTMRFTHHASASRFSSCGDARPGNVRKTALSAFRYRHAGTLGLLRQAKQVTSLRFI